MGLWDTLRIAIRALVKNKMRAALTVLGVVIGIAAVTTMVSIGQSASTLVQNQFQALGTNVIIILPELQRRGGVRSAAALTLTAEDAQAMSQECRSVLAASPIVGAGGQVIYGSANWSPSEMSGVGVDYLTVRNWGLDAGGFFTRDEIYASANVCVIGYTVVAKLFQTSNPLGQTVRVGNIPFRVIGILEKKGANIVGQDQDDLVLLPYTTVRSRLQGSNFKNVDAILASAISPESMPLATREIEQLLYDRHAIPLGEQADFRVQSTTEIADALAMITGSLTMMLAAIAGISLLVGGVGIMNIMLVSVTERTREIGIRMAVGARGRDILRQFLVESVVLSSIGGLIGVGLGIAASAGATMLINSLSSGSDWPVVVSFPAAGIAMAFAAAVGVFFGYYPARRASRLDPIDALRYE